MKRRKPLVVDPDVKQLWPALSNLLLFDPVHPTGAIYDIDPFGNLVLDPTPKVIGGTYRAAIPLPGWPSLDAFDQAMVQLILRAARSRVAGILDINPDGALRLLSYGISLRQIVLHPKTLAKVKPGKELRVWPTHHMRPNIIIGLEYPEEVGRVCGQGLHSLGAFIFNPNGVAGVRIKNQ
jgi:hypothetical protein